MRSNLVKSLSAALAAGILIFAFQNCGKAGFDDALAEDNVDMASKDTAAPFAFDSTFDQITYNSCFGAGLTSNPAYFTLKAGAYDNGGVKLTQNFITYANSSLKPQYPATTVTVEQMKAYVGETQENASPTLQMALRTRGSPQQIRNPSGSTPALGVDYMNLMTDLTDDRIMEPIFRGLGGVVNYFPLALNQSQRVMEAKLTYNGNEGLAYSLRNDLSNNGMLSLTYTAAGTSPFAARLPASATSTNSAGQTVTNTTIAYGRGYNLAFAADIAPATQRIANNAAVQPNSRNPNNILVGVNEINLENPSVASGGVWSCAQGRRYLIVRADDAANTASPGYCPAESVDRMGDANYRRELEIIRRHLPPEQWHVNVDRRCVYPKAGSCYKNTSGTTDEPVEYNQANECYQGIQGLANPAITNRCAQYVTVCLRN
ncbi:hypothetical protein [Bdellovibrio sp. HCB337]|uniref:hypothetical protein n=1 Tax=Bdellovibrio sp. HCB337 TaxID=3394358 RepID=UPI0039A68485